MNSTLKREINEDDYPVCYDNFLTVPPPSHNWDMSSDNKKWMSADRQIQLFPFWALIFCPWTEEPEIESNHLLSMKSISRAHKRIKLYGWRRNGISSLGSFYSLLLLRGVSASILNSNKCSTGSKRRARHCWFVEITRRHRLSFGHRMHFVLWRTLLILEH